MGMSAAREIRARKGEGSVALLLVLLICAQTQIIRLFLLLLSPRPGERHRVVWECGRVKASLIRNRPTATRSVCSCNLFIKKVKCLLAVSDNFTSQIQFF